MKNKINLLISMVALFGTLHSAVANETPYVESIRTTIRLSLDDIADISDLNTFKSLIADLKKKVEIRCEEITTWNEEKGSKVDCGLNEKGTLEISCFKPKVIEEKGDSVVVEQVLSSGGIFIETVSRNSVNSCQVTGSLTVTNHKN